MDIDAVRRALVASGLSSHVLVLTFSGRGKE